MKAIIQCELLCGCCNRPMQWSISHEMVEGVRVETDYVACRSLKCEERNKRYQQPSVQLVPLGDLSFEGFLGTATNIEEAMEAKPKRKYTRKAKP